MDLKIVSELDRFMQSIVSGSIEMRGIDVCIICTHANPLSLLPINTGRGHNCMNNVCVCGKAEPGKIFPKDINQEDSTMTLI